jgi:ribosomal protein L40E
MKGPLNVIRRRRTERPAERADAEQAATEAPTTAQPAAGAGPATTSGGASEGQMAGAPGDTAAEHPAGGEGPATTVPAGADSTEPRVTFRSRGRLRRRLRYLRRVRELGFRDLGGLVFDQHRFSSVNEELVRGKLAALAAVDAELRALERALDDRRPITELREPGISVCARCGALHGSEARFCPSCGVAVRGPLAIGEVGDAVGRPVADLGAASAPLGPDAAPAAPLWATPGVAPAAQPEAEPQPSATEVAEREAAKAQAEAAPLTDQPTQVMRPVSEAQAAAAEPPLEPPAGDAQRDDAQRGGEQRTDGQAPRTDPAAQFAQPTGERSEP